MLELQRASAGSGKTYALAKKFIWYFITIRVGDRANAPRRLRTPAELNDSLSHILAVTFTNKATNEMQQRIVEKLAALAAPNSGKAPDYQEDFLRMLEDEGHPAPLATLKDTCRKALASLLNNYSDFHVSTIDSFFQIVLRTFAYESDINDSFQVEIDSKYLSSLTIDGLLEDINTGHASHELKYWISELMDRNHQGQKKWNIFTKSAATPYGDLINSVKKLENEEFKYIRKDLEDYFRSGVDLIRIYEDLKNKYGSMPGPHYDEAKKLADRLERQLINNPVDPKDLGSRGIFGSILSKVRKYKADDIAVADLATPKLPDENASYANRRKINPAPYIAAEALYLELREAFMAWRDAVASPEFRHWTLYRDNLPFLGLLRSVIEKRADILNENNAVELGETNSILRAIIGKDDAPFIYERLGTRLNHFLIDEFQDTSSLQWENIEPLLSESISRGNENLVIGDAKQSIYRFRNADSNLITTVVPEKFGISNDSEDSQNVNWRSLLRVVQFNNSFFEWLSRRLSIGCDSGRRDFTEEYSNVVQMPRNKKELGYVEVRIGEYKAKGEFTEASTACLPGLVCSLLDRGYAMRDIAVLVRSNSDGECAISSFIAHNSIVKNPEHRIEFVSEESLKLASSPAVSLVISVLETISRGADTTIREGEEARNKGVADWNRISGNFRFFAMRHPELSTPEQLRAFLEGGADNDAIGRMLSEMQAVSLPALVESIAAHFLSEDMRRDDAVFLAAFQDIVIEYCERNPSDIASFLRWWDTKGATASISSPEGTDAVTVMTVHKSKGLEFPVVIIPYADEDFRDSAEHAEWRWVKPRILSSGIGSIPPYMPVSTGNRMKGTLHEGDLFEFYDLKKMDSLNTLYVAFTRAERELYVFTYNTPPTKNSTATQSGIGYFLKDFFNETMAVGAGGDICRLGAHAISADTIGEKPEGAVSSSVPFTGEIYKIGCPEAAVEKKKEEDTGRLIDNYRVNGTPRFLVYRDIAVPTAIDGVGTDDEEEDNDPRSEGNLMHELMARVRTLDDLPHALLRMKTEGLATAEGAAKIEEYLRCRILQQGVSRWFDGSLKVINERNILRGDSHMLRPDRIMVTPDGDAIVVDYKFGMSLKKHHKYCRQVSDYVDYLKKTGRFGDVKGYLWYVRREEVVEVKSEN